LAAVGARTGVGHGKGAAVVAQLDIGFILEAVAPNALAAAAGTGGVAALDHEVPDDAVKDQAVVVAVLRMCHEVLTGFRGLLRKETDGNIPHIGVHDRNGLAFLRPIELIHRILLFIVMFIVFMAMLIVSVMKLALFMSILIGSVAIFAAFVTTTAVLMRILVVLIDEAHRVRVDAHWVRGDERRVWDDAHRYGLTRSA